MMYIIRTHDVTVQAMPRPLDLAADGGVFENEPAVRTDVVRSDEFEPDVIPVAQMRNTRVMWARKERQQDQPTNYKQPAPEVNIGVYRPTVSKLFLQFDYAKFVA